MVGKRNVSCNYHFMTLFKYTLCAGKLTALYCLSSLGRRTHCADFFQFELEMSVWKNNILKCIIIVSEERNWKGGYWQTS